MGWGRGGHGGGGRGRIVGCWEDGVDDRRGKDFYLLCAREYNGLWDLLSHVAAWPAMVASGLPMGAVRQMATRG